MKPPQCRAEETEAGTWSGNVSLQSLHMHGPLGEAKATALSPNIRSQILRTLAGPASHYRPSCWDRESTVERVLYAVSSWADSQLISTLNGPWVGDNGKPWHFLTFALLVTTERQKGRRMIEKESRKNKTDLVALPHGGGKTVRVTSPPCVPASSVDTSLTVLSS